MIHRGTRLDATSHVTGSPDPPPPYKIVRAYPNLKFNHPLLMARCPGSDRLFVGEQAGVLHSFRDSPDAKAELFFDLRSDIKTVGQLPGAKRVEAVYSQRSRIPSGLRGRTGHMPTFLLHARAGEKRRKPHISADGSPRVAVHGHEGRSALADRSVQRADRSSRSTQGGQLWQRAATFISGPTACSTSLTAADGKPNPNPPDENWRPAVGHLRTSPLSSILRIDVDHPAPGKLYGIPKDNPFVGNEGRSARGVERTDSAIHGGHELRREDRRPLRRLMSAWELWEMIHRVEKGGNYGWAAMEGPQPIKPQKLGPTPISSAAGSRACRTRSRAASPAAGSIAASSSPSSSAPTFSATGRRGGSGRPASTAIA